MTDPLPLSAEEKRRRIDRLINEGARLLRSQRFGEALESLHTAYELAPSDPDVLINYGGALVMNGKWRRAVSILEAGVQEHPDHPRLWLNLAAAYLGRLEISGPEHQERALSAYLQAIALDPVAPSAHYNIGLIFAERREWSVAATWFDAALQANPADRDAELWIRRMRDALARETEADE